MTAVEWLSEQLDNELELYNSEWLKIEKIIEQAKEMEKEQIKDVYDKNEVNEMFNTLKKNSINNVAIIRNVDLFISRWKKQFKC